MPKLDTKKLFIAIGFIALVLLLGAMIYFIFLRPIVAPPPTVPTEEAPGIPGVLPPAEEAVPRAPIEEAPTVLPLTAEIPPDVSTVATGDQTAVTTLTERPAYSPTLAGDGSNLLYYDKGEGKFYRINEDGEKTLISDKIFHDVEKVNWAPDKNKTILEYPDGSKLYYNFANKKQATIPKHWEEFDFAPSSDQIAFKSMGSDVKNRWLAISNPDGTGTKPLEALGENGNKVQVDWSPNRQIIATTRTGQPQGFTSQEVLFVGMHGENFKSIIVEGWGFDYEWTPDGNKILYNAHSINTDNKPGLWIVGAQGDNIGSGRKNLKINTWVDKCTIINSSTAYCGVPREMKSGAGYQPVINDDIPDDIYKINLVTGAKSLIAVPYGDYTVDQLMVTENEENLFFTDKATGKLNKLKLK